MIPKNERVELDPLNDGKSLMTLIDYMGGDMAVVNDARASFDKESEEFGMKDEKLLRYLVDHEHTSPFRSTVFKFKIKAPLYVCRQHWKHVIASNHNDEQLGWNEKCYSEDTQVYTSTGFKFWGDVTKDDELAAVNIDDGSFSFEKPSEIYSYDYDGELIRMYSRDLDSLTTPNHRNFTSYYHGRKDTNGWSKFEERTSQEILDKKLKFEKLPSLPELSLPKGTSDEFHLGKLYGFTLGDGGKSNDNMRIYYHVTKQRKKQILEEFESLGLVRITNRHAKDDYYYARLTSKEVFFESCYFSAKDKYIDWDNIPHTKSFLDGLLIGLMSSDGHISDSNSWTYSSVSDVLSKDIEKLATLLGREVRFSNYEGRQRINKLTINIRRPKLIKNVEKVSYSGKVYCASVSTGALLVRRNDKNFVSGNSFRYVEINDSDEFYIPETFRMQSKNNKQATVGSLSEDLNAQAKYLYTNAVEDSFHYYQELLNLGVGREQARGVLVPAVYTTYVWTVSFQALFNFIHLRQGHGAQSEIKQYADAATELITPYVPVSMEAWRAKSERLDKLEQQNKIVKVEQEKKYNLFSLLTRLFSI